MLLTHVIVLGIWINKKKGSEFSKNLVIVLVTFPIHFVSSIFKKII